MVLGELFGGFAGLAGNSKAHDEGKGARKRGLGLFGINEDYWNRESLFDARDRFKRESVANIEKGYRAAGKNLRSAGTAAKRDARATGQQTQANAQQSMASRGLYNTTVMDNATRGISADTSRAIQDIQLSLGNMRSQLELDKMEAMDTALGRNLGLDEQSAWDWFKFMVGSAGYAPGTTNAFGFGSPYDAAGRNAQYWGSIGSGIEDGLSAIPFGGGSPSMGGSEKSIF